MKFRHILTIAGIATLVAAPGWAQTVGIGTTQGGATAQVTAAISKVVSENAGFQMRTQVMGGTQAYIPVVNAGGGDQHPTQALLDLYTIYRAIDGIDGVSLVLMGDLSHSGASRSLCYLLAKYSGIRLWLVSPKELPLGEDLLEYLVSPT